MLHATGVASYDELTLAGEPGTQTEVQLKAELGGFPKFPRLELGVQPTITGAAVVTFEACPRGYILASTKQCLPCRPGWSPVTRTPCGRRRCLMPCADTPIDRA